MFGLLVFREADFIVYFEKLETLVLDHNLITSTTVFPKMDRFKESKMNLIQCLETVFEIFSGCKLYGLTLTK